MKKLPDGSRMTYEGLEARYDVLAAELAQAQARVTELSDMKPQTMKQRIETLEAALRDLYTECDAMQHEELDEHPTWGPIMRAAAAALSGARTSIPANQHEWHDGQCLRCGCLIHHVAAICLCNGAKNQ